jgi:two-component system sensor kinase Ihk
MKIFAKTFFYTLSLLVLIALLANGLILSLMPSVYTKQKRQDLNAQADQLAWQLEDAKREDIVRLMGNVAVHGQTNIVVRIGEDKYALIVWSGGSEADDTVTTSVVVTSGADSEDTYSVSKAYAEGDSVKTGRVEITSGSPSLDFGSFYGAVKTIEAQRSFTMEGQSGTLTVSMTLAPVEEAVGAIVSLLPISMILCAAIAILFSLFYARAMTRPIKAISDETRHMTLLERDARCEIKSRDEFGELAGNVNGLYENLLSTIDNLEAELKKVAAAERAKTDFLRAASHELKTPVTAVSVIMDNMILGVGKYKNHDEWLPKCKKQVDHLSKMLCDILDASQLDDAAEADAEVDLETVCSEIIEPYIMIARAKGLSLYVDWSAAFTVTTMPPKLLGKALSNIFSNAVQHTLSGGRLAVYCKGRSLFVENECESIPEYRLSRIFEPFIRQDEFRNSDSGGNGLGLYITASVLHRLELDFSFEPMQSPDGMRFTINF